MKKLIFGATFLIISFLTLFSAFAQEDQKQRTEVEAFRKNNRIRTINGQIESKKKEVELRYAKVKTSKEYDKSTGQMVEKQVVDLKQPILYEKVGKILFEHRYKQFTDEQDIDKKIVAGEKVLVLQDKLIELFGTDTDKLEKQLKKATKPEEIGTIVGL